MFSGVFTGYEMVTLVGNGLKQLETIYTLLHKMTGNYITFCFPSGYFQTSQAKLKLLIQINYGHKGIDLEKFATLTYITEAVVWNLLDSSNSENKITEEKRVNNAQLG